MHFYRTKNSKRRPQNDACVLVRSITLPEHTLQNTLGTERDGGLGKRSSNQSTFVMAGRYDRSSVIGLT